MYIAPNSDVRLLRNVNIDNDYEHTIYFDNNTEQTNYFIGKTKYNLVNYSYQKCNKGVIKVGINADNLYDCSYIMFRNSSFGTKWFYAFITSVEYINNETSAIYYEIDVMQTWMFETQLEMCFVEREHTVTDIIGEHIEPESLNTGEYVFNGKYEPITMMRDMVACISIVDTDEAVDGTLYDGVYGGAQLWVYDSSDVEGINAKINEYLQKPDAITSIYMFPKILIGGNIPDNHRLTYGRGGSRTDVTLDGIKVGDSLDGYIPKNNKMYTYPYNFYHVDNASGSELNLRYEFFDKLTPVIEISGTITQPVAMVCRPTNGYKGVPSYSDLGGYTTLNTESLQLNSYPMCSWNVDAYKAWLAQNSVPLVLNTIGGVSSVANSTYYASKVLKLSGGANIANAGVQTAIDLLSQFYTASIQADISKGTFSNGCVNVADGKQQFYGGRCCVNSVTAKMIDDYFTMYGYAVGVVKIPNTHSRPHWNYVKTSGANIIGSIPNDDMKIMKSVYDKGITFWKNGDEIGDYSLLNAPND